MGRLSIQSIHEEMTRGHVADFTDAQELFDWMVLLHTHKVQLVSACPEDSPTAIVYGATQRGVASLAAKLWGNREDKERTRYEHWYKRYSMEGQYESIDSVPPEMLKRIEVLRQRLLSNPLVKAVIPEEE